MPRAPPGLAKAYEEDVIQDITPYIEEYMPNYAAVLETLPESTVKNTQVEDAQLAFHQIKDGSYSGNGFVTRGDWIADLSWEWSGNLITLDEFTDYCRTIHETYSVPNTIYMYDGTVGLEAAFDTEIPVLKGDGFMTTVTSAVFRYDDEISSGWITDGYREYLEWVLTMMDEGIIERDYLSLETDRMVTNQFQADGTIGVWQSNADQDRGNRGYLRRQQPGPSCTGHAACHHGPLRTVCVERRGRSGCHQRRLLPVLHLRAS